MAQSRKKAILEQVERQRRRNQIVSISAIVIIAIVIVAVVIALPRSGNAVPLPAYLENCVTGTLLYHSHPTLSITINGSSVVIPANVGISAACNHPIHTHATDDVLHVETNENRDYTLGDFFKIWGNTENSAQRAIFNSTQIFGAKAINGHTIAFTVNGVASSEFQNYVLPHTACESASACQSQTGYTLTQIAIIYS